MKNRTRESGNVIFFVLLAVALVAIVTAAIRGSGVGSNIDSEQLSIRASQVRQYASELERAVTIIMQNQISEQDIRFAHQDAHATYGDINDTPENQVFSKRGGGASFRVPDSAISSATQWEFYGHTHFPDVGTDAPELIAVLPNVTAEFCALINKQNDYDTATQPMDTTGDCLNAGDTHRFSNGQLYSTGAGIDGVNEATFTVKPSLQACVECNGNEYHFYHVLIAR